MSADLAGKVVVVTGGSRGLGRAMVRAYAERGADVVIASRKLDNCQRLADEVSAHHRVRALPLACNVSDWDQCDTLVDRVYDELGRVDVLVNNAGLSPSTPASTRCRRRCGTRCRRSTSRGRSG